MHHLKDRHAWCLTITACFTVTVVCLERVCWISQQHTSIAEHTTAAIKISKQLGAEEGEVVPGVGRQPLAALPGLRLPARTGHPQCMVEGLAEELLSDEVTPTPDGFAYSRCNKHMQRHMLVLCMAG